MAFIISAAAVGAVLLTLAPVEFIICRFQYIALANFLGKGTCAGKEDQNRQHEYVYLFHPSLEWNDFYRHSSRRLNTEHTLETCFCHWKNTMPESKTEARSLTYNDEQVRGC